MAGSCYRAGRLIRKIQRSNYGSVAAITQMGAAGLGSLGRSEPTMAAIGPTHTPACAAKGFRLDVERAGRLELTRDEGGPRGRGGEDMHGFPC